MIPLRVDIFRTRFAFINTLLILVNVYAFLNEVMLSPRAGQALVYSFGLIPAREQLLFARHGISIGQAVFPMFTSMFLHGGWMHLLGNMLFLWVFGGAVEEALGHFQYLIFYLICGVGSALVHTVFNLGSKVPTIGASGAISGVMGAFIVLFPKSRVTTLIPALLLFFYRAHSCVPDAWILVLHPVLQRRGFPGNDRPRGRRVVGARGRFSAWCGTSDW